MFLTNLIHLSHTSLVPSHTSTQVRGDIWFHLWKEFGINLTTYFVHRKTVITNLNFEISSPPNQQVAGLTIKDTKTVHFLPVKVSQTFPNLLIFEAYNCALKSVTKVNFENLRKLRAVDLQHNQISTFSEDTFDDLRMLIHLDLANNKIHEIDGSSFKSLQNLRNLYLGFNEIENLPLNVFKPLKELLKLALPSNKIREIHNEHFSNNKKLTNVWLNENLLECLDEELFDGKNRLKWLYLEGNVCINDDYRDMTVVKFDIAKNCRNCE